MTEIEQNSHSCTFEAAFLRLEEILDKMNSNEISLDESLTLYEEADRLIAMCSKKLNEAERKVEILIKNRNGEVQFGPDQKPLSQDYLTKPTPPK